MFRRILAALALLVTFGVAAKVTPAEAATGCTGWNSGLTYRPPYGWISPIANSKCVDLQQGDPSIGTPAEWQQVWVICDPSTQVKHYGPQVFGDNEVSSYNCTTGYVYQFGYRSGFTS